MSEVTDIVVPMLQRIQASQARMEIDIATLKDDVSNIKVRTTLHEEGQSAMNRRMDTFGFRLERIERRLDLIQV